MVLLVDLCEFTQMGLSCACAGSLENSRSLGKKQNQLVPLPTECELRLKRLLTGWRAVMEEEMTGLPFQMRHHFWP